MAGTTDPRAAGFDAATFRSAIRFAMNMGLPDTPAKRITFRWNPSKIFAAPDPAGNPYAWDQAPIVETDHVDVQVDASVQFVPALLRAGAGTAFGKIDQPKIIVTVLDEQFALITGADTILMDDSVYDIDYVAPPQGLFDVTIYDIYATSQDEV